jgi:hypothetical protein
MRDEVDATAPRADGLKYLPIEHALANFDCSASSWTPEHLTRFQVVVLEGQNDQQLFPADWAVRDDDKAVVKMIADGFFAPTKVDVSKGKWDNTKPFHNFFLHLLHIQRESPNGAPRTTPKLRTMEHRLAKRLPWARAFKNAALIATLTSDTEYHPSVSPMSTSSLRPNPGPRRTSSYVLMHDFLVYLASIELQVWSDYNQWQPTYCPIEVIGLTLAPMPRGSR